METPKTTTCTRAEAIKDSVLHDVSKSAHEAGLTHPTAITAEAWKETVAWDHGGLQDEAGRLWDVLSMARLAIKSVAPEGSEATFTVYRVPNTEAADEAEPTGLIVRVGPGDSRERVLTIMSSTEG